MKTWGPGDYATFADPDYGPVRGRIAEADEDSVLFEVTVRGDSPCLQYTYPPSVLTRPREPQWT